MHFNMRRHCTQEFLRDSFVEFPMLARDPAYLNFFWHICWSPFRDAYSPGIVTPREVCAWAEGKELELRNNEYTAESFLAAFSRDVVELEIIEYSAVEQRARAVVPKFSEEFKARVQREANEVRRAKYKVYYDTGKPVTPARERKRLEALSMAPSIPPEGHEAEALLEYLNGLSASTFENAVRLHMDEAWETASKLENAHAREQEQRKLLFIQEFPKGCYNPSRRGRTTRIFQPTGMATLASDVRRALTPDWMDLDLGYSQIATVAMLWGIGAVDKFLRAGGNPWNEMLSYLEIDSSKLTPTEHKGFKGAIKAGTYCSVFGMEERNIVAKLKSTPEFTSVLGEAAATRFVQAPLIRTLLDARTEAKQRVLSDGFGKTTTGRTIQLDRSLSLYEQGREAYSILAQQAQATEFQIAASVLPVFQGNKEARIGIWLHDGFSVAVTEERRKLHFYNLCRQAVHSKARELGVPTQLVWTNRPA